MGSFLRSAARRRPFRGNTALNNGHLAWYECDDDAANSTVTDSLGERDGSMWSDAAATTPANTSLAHVDINRAGTGGSFDFLSLYNFTAPLEASAGDVIHIDKPFTIAGWMFISTTSVQYVCGNMDAVAYQGFRAYTQSGTFTARLQDGSGAYFSGACTGLTNGEWNHFIATYDGLNTATSMTVYINGIQGSSSSRTLTPATCHTSNPFHVGCMHNYSTARSAQEFQMVGMWSRHFSQEDATNLYRRGTHLVEEKMKRYGIAHYRCMENAADTVVNDALGNHDAVSSVNTSSLYADAGPRAGSFSFNSGTVEYFDAPFEPSFGDVFEYNKPWTICFRVYNPGAPAADEGVFGNAIGYTGIYGWMDTGGVLSVRIRKNPGFYWDLTTGVLPVGWSTIVVGLDGSGTFAGCRLFYNTTEGSYVETGTSYGSIVSSVQMQFGDSPAHSGYAGNLANVVVLKEAPSQAMADAYEAGLYEEMGEIYTHHPCNDNRVDYHVEDVGPNELHGTSTSRANVLHSASGGHSSFDFSGGLAEDFTVALESIAGELFDIDKKFFVSFWIYRSTSGSNISIMGNIDASTIGTFFIYQGSITSVNMTMRNLGTSAYVYARSTIPAGWSHVVGGHNGDGTLGGMKLFLNRVPVPSIVTSGSGTVASSRSWSVGDILGYNGYDDKITDIRFGACEPTQELVDELFYRTMPLTL